MELLNRIRGAVDELFGAPLDVDQIIESFGSLSAGSSGDGVDTDSTAYQYRNLSDAQIDRRLSDADQDKIIKRAMVKYLKNPLIFRDVNMTVNYVIGTGFEYFAENEDLLAAIKRHWNDPDNAWDRMNKDRFRDRYITGEGFYPAFVNTISGHTKIGYLDPTRVKKVVTDPQNASKPVKVVTKGIGGQVREYWIVQRDEDGTLGQKITAYNPNGGLYRPYKGRETKGKLVGTCFFSPMNKFMSGSRGFPSSLSYSDWVDALDGFLFTRVENIKVSNAYIWHLIVKAGYSKKKMRLILQRFKQSLVAGGAIATTDRIEINAKFPDYRASDARNELKSLMGMICSGTGKPEHWLLGQGETTNRASALAMGDPTLMELVSLQDDWRRFVEYVIEFDIDQIRIFSSSDPVRLLKDEDIVFELTVPKINVEDESKNATNMQAAVRSLMQAEDSGWIEKVMAAQTFAVIASRLGTEIVIPQWLLDESDTDREERWARATQLTAEIPELPSAVTESIVRDLIAINPQIQKYLPPEMLEAMHISDFPEPEPYTEES